MSAEILDPGPAPRVSVVVLTWNRRPMLERALASVLAQTMGDLEAIVVDNESEDDTATWMAGLADPRVRCFRHANGGNLSVNRNYAIERARGPWVAFCDDDDYWEADKLERQLAEADAHPDVAIVCSEAVIFSGDPGTPSERRFGRVYGAVADEDITLDLLLRGRNEVAVSSSLIRREVLDDVGPWDADPAIFAIEDYQYWLRAAARGHRIRRLAAPLLRYRQHPAMVSSADSRVTLRKQAVVLDGLLERGVLDTRRYAEARRALRSRARVAVVKEWLKRVPGLKAAVYDRRRRRHTSGARDWER